jgi:hypothetical protein
VKRQKRTRIGKPVHKAKAAGHKPAYAHFGLRKDPFNTLALQSHNLGFFTGRRDLVERLTSDLHSLSNTGLAGEPGMGKSSLLNLLKGRAGRGVTVVTIGVPLDDATYLLTELLGELMEVLKTARGLDRRETARRLRDGSLDKTALLRIVRTLMARSKKPVAVFVDDVEKIRGDPVHHLTRSDRTLQFLEELKPLFEGRNSCFFVTLQEEFFSKVTQVVKDGAEPTVLGLFKNIVKVERFSVEELREVLRVRLKAVGHKGDPESFVESEGLRLALSLADGNPRRFLYLLSEGMVRAYLRRGRRIAFQDVFEAVNEHLKLDLVCKKLLFFLSKSGRAMAANADLQEFMGLDAISLSRRFDVLARERLVTSVDVVDGSRVYALPGIEPLREGGLSIGAAAKADGPSGQAHQKAEKPAIGVSLKGEKMYLLDEDQ